MPRKKELTLAEHIQRIAPSGGKARMASLSQAERTALATKGGLVGGKARARTLSARKRSAIAKQAAVARWGRQPNG
jgi:hypothetical protein